MPTPSTKMTQQKKRNSVYTPTKRRGPIAAEFSSPGPAHIKLASSFGSEKDGTQVSSPKFTMTARQRDSDKPSGPGPNAYNVTGCTKNGKDENTGASMHVKPRDPKAYVTPAPGDYAPEKSSVVLKSSPNFTFGVKSDISKPNGVPAPNCYSIPSLMGAVMEGGKSSSPCFTLSARHQDPQDKLKVPGPGSYSPSGVDAYKAETSPAFSMGQRTLLPQDHSTKPGPGAYEPERYYEEVMKGIQHTMGARIEDNSTSVVPGPGTYEAGDVDAMRNKLPAYSMGAKLEEEKKFKTPSPCAYETGNLDAMREKLPAYSMSTKTELPKDKTPRPSPNAYSPEKYYETLKGSEFTMGGRIEDVDHTVVPGPGTYDAGDMDAMKAKLPAYSMGAKLQDEKVFKTPSPTAYETGNVDAIRAKLPAYTMSPKTELPRDKTLKPAPNAYCPEKYYEDSKGPQFTMGGRIEDVDHTVVPGPGTYDAGDMDAMKAKLPVYSMGIKLEEMELFQTPSPWAYEVSKLDALKEKLPAYTMAPKTELPTDKTAKPAPNAYCPEQYDPSMKPEFSFGVKHSPYVGTLKSEQRNV